MIGSLTLLLVCQLAGEALARAAQIPVPGPVFGFALLFIGLMLRDRLVAQPRPLAQTPLGQFTRQLLGLLSLLFIPAGVGIVANFQVFQDYGLAVAVAIIGSTLITIVATAWIFLALSPKSGAEK